MTLFMPSLGAVCWCGGTNSCKHTLVCICSLLAMKNWPVNQLVFAVRIYFYTKTVVQTLRCFQHDFYILRQDQIPLHNSTLKGVDSNVHGSVVGKFLGLSHSVHTAEIT
jgi:hypothetical protein